ncbi:hypothetical protein J6P52_01475, partial [bacterium]|nr:hypothetical protein [bacterium]
ELGELTYTAASIAAGISVTYPKTGVSLTNDEAGQIPNVTLSYNGIALENTSKTSDFTLTGFEKSTNTNDSSVVSKIESLINQNINIVGFDNQTAANTLLINSSGLITAIKTAINKEISTGLNNGNLTINGITYTVSDILNNISVALPAGVLLVQDENGQMPNVTLKYNETVLSNSKTNTYTVTGFEQVTRQVIGTTPMPPNSTGKVSNEQIAAALESLLNQTIEISGFNEVSAIYALNNDQTSLVNAITSYISNQIQTNGSKYNFEDLNITTSQIIKNIKVILPSTISLSNNINAEIPNVLLVYNGILLKNSISSKYIIQGFDQSTASKTNSNENRNTDITNELDSLLNQDINIVGFTNITAADALLNSNENNLIESIKAAVIKQISSLINDFIFAGISYTTSDILSNLSINLPSSITTNDDENAQIPGVQILYNGNVLTNSSSSDNSTFTIKGFEITSIDDIGTAPIPSTSSNTSTSRNELIANSISSYLNQSISLPDYSNTTAAIALLNPNNLIIAIKKAIESELQNSKFDLTVDLVTYTLSNIINNLTIQLPSGISISDDTTSQIPGVEISYNGNLLKNSESSTFIINGFQTTTAANIGTTSITINNLNSTSSLQVSTRNQIIANLLGNLLNENISLSSYSSMSAADALSNSTSLTSSINAFLIQEISSSNINLNIGGIIYTASDIVKNITISFPQNTA